MASRRIRPRAQLDDDHVLVRLRVGFRGPKGTTFPQFAEHLVDAIGIRPGTSFDKTADRGPFDLQIASLTEDDPQRDDKVVRGVIEFGIPQSVIPVEAGIPLALAISTYGSVYDFVREYQVTDMNFPESFCPELPGPKYGAEFVSSLDGAETRLGLILKPRFLSTETDLKTLVNEYGMAGIDYVSDDELTVGTSALPFDERVKLVTGQLREVEQKVGRSIPYIANVTSNYRTAFRLASRARKLGVAGVMVNSIAMGYDVIHGIARRQDLDLAVVANSIGRGVLTSGPGYRVAPELLCKVARLAGADAVYTGPLAGTINNAQSLAGNYRTALNEPYYKTCVRKPSSAVMSGGIGLPEIIKNENAYDAPLMLSVGREFVEPVVAGVPAKLVVEVVRNVWKLKRAGDHSGARELVTDLVGKGGDSERCVKALRAEEAAAQ